MTQKAETRDYEFKNTYSSLLNRLKKSLAVKKKCGYSREVSPGFVTEDLDDIVQDISGEIVVLTQAFNQRMWIKDLNLRETEEAAKFVQIKIAKQKLEEAQA